MLGRVVALGLGLFLVNLALQRLEYATSTLLPVAFVLAVCRRVGSLPLGRAHWLGAHHYHRRYFAGGVGAWLAPHLRRGLSLPILRGAL